MGVPDVPGVVAALETLGSLVRRPEAAGLRAGLGRGEIRLPQLHTDLVRVVYRLVFAELVRARGGVVPNPLASLRPDALDLGLLDGSLLREAVVALGATGGGGGDDQAALGALHEGVLGIEPAWDETAGYRVAGTSGSGRKAAGAWFTPTALVEHLLDETLEPALDEAPDPLGVAVLDPACGSGLFLAAAARRIARRCVVRPSRPSRHSPDDELAASVLGCLHGIDRDAAAVELARITLWLDLVRPGEVAPMPAVDLRVDDALLGQVPSAAYDVVVGNPPFLNQLERLTASSRSEARRLNELAGGALGPYTDISAVFLHRGVSWVRDGGRVGLVQPQSLLAARDASGVRRHVARTCALESLWASETPVFEARVLTVAPVLRKGGEQGPVRRTHGPSFAPLPSRRATSRDLEGEWSFLLAAGLGIPEVVLAAPEVGGRLGDLAECTADFRDQYYGLAGAVREAADCPSGVPLVTTGLVEPAECLWGRRTTRFLKRRWEAPVIDLEVLEPRLRAWARARLVPKVLVATQGRVVEAVVDEDGAWLPSVPTITVAAPKDELWRVLAVLLAPPVAAHAAATYAGTALTMRGIKLSAGQVAQLPLPVDQAAWDEGAGLAELTQRHGAVHLPELGAVMCAAYQVGSEVLEWWVHRWGTIGTLPAEFRT